MRIKRIILFYLFVFIAVTVIFPTISPTYSQSQEDITQYIIDLSKDIYQSIPKPDQSILYNSKGEVRLKLLLSPWGELKDAYISESSDNKELDNLCLKTIWLYKRYQPFPEALGTEDLWIDVPIIFDVDAELALPDGRGKVNFAATATEQGRGKVNFAATATEQGRGKVNFAATAATKEQGSPGLGINEAVDIALENHMAAKIAQEEIELSRLKIREARRSLYPAASANYLETTGKTTGVTQDFTDKEYKLKFEYPLYYGSRLKYAVEQAVANMKASTNGYNKVLQDLRVEVETAFYSYLASKMNVKLHRSLLEDVRDIFENAKKRFDRGLSTKSEFMQADTQMNQINYQIISSENELAMARLTLSQAMNVDDKEDFISKLGIDMEKDLEPVDLDINLEDCIDLAFKSRPDLKQKEYLIDVNDYENKIVESKNQLKVDLTGTYGKSGGAYQSETLNLANDWYMGFKVTKPLGGNTLSSSYTKDKTSQKHGQSTRTESVSKSVELGLLDNLQHFSEEKSSEIGLKKARDEFQQTRDAVSKEVNDAYLNYKKGLIQVRTNLEKIKYKEEELKIAKARAGLNEITISDLIQAYMGLADEKSYYIEAVGSLHQSLAKLNKATGYALFLDNENFKLANTNNR